MRTALLASLLMAVMLLPAAAAQDEWSVLLEDPEDDVDYARPCQAFQGCTAHMQPEADLVRVEVRESETAIHLRLEARQRSSTDLPEEEGVVHESRVTLLAPGAGNGSQLLEFQATDDDRFEPFRFYHILERSGGGGPTAGEGFSYRDRSWALSVVNASTPYSWEITLQKSGLTPDGKMPTAPIVLRDVAAELYRAGPRGDTQDTAPETRPGPDWPLARVPTPPENWGGVPWTHSEGPDRAGGPSVAVGPDDAVHVVFYTWDDDRGLDLGVYHAWVEGGAIQTERIGAMTPPGNDGRDSATTTALVIDEDGGLHAVWYLEPGSPGVRYAQRTPDGWTVEDPLDGLGEPPPLDTSARAHPALAASDGRLVAALPTAGLEATVLLERAADGTWEHVATLNRARHVRLAFDSPGVLHAAWFHARGDARDGTLLHATEATGWDATEIGQELEDYGAGRLDAEANGGFDFDIAPDGTPVFAWQEGREDGVRFATLAADGVSVEGAGLVPSHGNPQIRVQMAVDAAGRIHVASGYGGLDLYALRTASGAWFVEDVERGDMFDIAAVSAGTPVLVFTEPHGGTTLALSARGDDALGVASALPIPATGFVILLVVWAAVVAARRRH